MSVSDSPSPRVDWNFVSVASCDDSRQDVFVPRFLVSSRCELSAHHGPMCDESMVSTDMKKFEHLSRWRDMTLTPFVPDGCQARMKKKTLEMP